MLPHRRQTWRQALPGALVAGARFFLAMQLLPLYVAHFGRQVREYAAFGLFLLLMLWSYVTGLLLVLGAELNATLEDPGLATRSARLRRETEAARRRAAPAP